MKSVFLRLVHHHSYRWSLLFGGLLLGTGIATLVLYKFESCYDPCSYLENTLSTVFGFWNPRPAETLRCVIPGVAKRICPVLQIHPLFYVVFDVFVMTLAVYLIFGMREMWGRWQRGESIVAPKR